MLYARTEKGKKVSLKRRKNSISWDVVDSKGNVKGSYDPKKDHFWGEGDFELSESDEIKLMKKWHGDLIKEKREWRKELNKYSDKFKKVM